MARTSRSKTEAEANAEVIGTVWLPAPEPSNRRPLRPYPGRGEVQVAENLRVVTGPAEYGGPETEEVIEVE